jgi:long-subunit acyl-CoA synthetase (AMP-forming)/GNAT superfamily N-acetyltransferase
MDVRTGQSVGDLVERLARIPQDEAVQQLDETLRVSAAAERDESATLDAAAVVLLGDRLAGDALLESLPLVRLDELARRHLDRLNAVGGKAPIELRHRAWDLLDVLRRSRLLCRISRAGETARWAERLLDIIDASHFTFGQLFRLRADAYGSRTLFRLRGLHGSQLVTWHQAAGRVDLIARGLLAVSEEGAAPVAILSENRLEVALIDLACLSSGTVNVMIPATATDSDVAYILGHAGAATVVVSSRDQLQKVLKARDTLPKLKTIISLDVEAGTIRGVQPFEDLLERASEIPSETVAERRDRTRIDDLATVMYTSGTTGTPKGICFSHRNMVFKRFARALALPEVGEQDSFLAYLPLYHTFGRFLELQGCVFWGATYCFAQNPAIETLVRQMQELQPTVLISIPMKWTQLYDLIRQDVDVESADDAEIQTALRRLTGDRLRWGLSAAGYLDPEIFRFFQRHNVELLSGFGMTEATGGITMTPPGRYKDDSQGCALPGIEASLGDGGELLIRGPYVTIGYLGRGGPEPATDEHGWLHTGDLMETDEDGFFRIIDRKKEIYKNVKGETIAPQKIENLFLDFESVGRIFLVGDNRPYNTALLYPNPQFKELDLGRLPPQELKAHFRSLVVTANSFLAPFERIVDFAVIDRDFEAARDELTPKGTFRRKVIARHFADVIRLLYRRTTFLVGGAQVLFPNWLFQALGVTAQDLRVEGTAITLASVGASLTVRWSDDERVQVGSAVYRSARRPLDLGLLLSTPRLWLGNEQLVRFAPLDLELRYGRRRAPQDLEWRQRAELYVATEVDRDAAGALLRKKALDLMDLHRAALLVEAEEPNDAVLGVRLLEAALGMEEGPLVDAARRILGRTAGARPATVVRRAFQLLAVAPSTLRYRETVARFLDAPVRVLDPETTAVLVERGLSADGLGVFVSEAEARCHRADHSAETLETAVDLLALLAEFGAAHPAHYRRLRAVLTRIALLAASDRVRARARDARARLNEGFRKWLGAPSRIAVDPETGHEYRWEDVIAFDEDVDAEARERLLAAIKSTPLLAEAAFLFADRATVTLGDILPGGVWVRLLGTDHGKSVFRVGVRTRVREQFDLAVNLNRTLSLAEVTEEIDWLIVCSEAREPGPLVEDVGGHWEQHGLWTEEFVPGDTLERALNRLSRRPQDEERFKGVWPYAAWSGLSKYVDFWNRTGRQLVVADPTPANVIVPMHDYQTGARLVSIAARRPFGSLVALLRSFHEQFVAHVERDHPRLAGIVGWDVILSAVLEILGEAEGCAQLRRMLEATDEELGDGLRPAVQGFLGSIERRGFLPRGLFFAAQRFQRWSRLNADATLHAQASTLHELYETYGLSGLHATHPETRARFFRETVFRAAAQPLADGLEDIIGRLRARQLASGDLSTAVADLRAQLDLTPADNYFLTRLSYPYLKPEDEAELVAAAPGGVRQSEMVVTVADADGQPFQIRHALSAREAGRLHRMFLGAKLNVQFRPEHRFLVAVSERGHLMGGLFYELQPEARTAHMDKVVVAERFQRKGVAAALLEELSKRLKTAGFQSLTTGFFRPQFFYRLGFIVEGRYAGLVRALTDA